MGGNEFENSLLANHTIEATVAFIDICSFTTISESESADTVVRLLNNYFDVMVKEIIAGRGYVDKFIGDAIMAVFHGEFHLDRAIDACLAVRNEIAKLPALDEEISFRPNVTIGINSGEMISGNIGSASLRRFRLYSHR
jgi:class 3 adenylate cyclase